MKKQDKDEIICILMLLAGFYVLIWAICPVYELSLPVSILVTMLFIVFILWEYFVK